MASHVGCWLCGELYIESIVDWYSSEKICKKCITIRNDLQTHKINKDLIYEKYNIIVNYLIMDRRHQGNCSDYIGEVVYMGTNTYPLLKIFKKSDVIDINNNKLDYYKKPNKYCGHCGEETISYMIDSVEIKVIDD